MPDPDDCQPDFASLSDRVYRLCLGLLADPDAARDASQEALARAWSRRERRRADVSWWTWAAGFAIRVCREGRRRARPATLPDEVNLPPAEATTVCSSYGWLKQAVARLPNRQREIVVLRFVLGFSVQHTADVLNCPVGTVKSNLFKAVRRLKDDLPAREHGDELPDVSDMAH